jgi:trypsin
MLSHLSWRQRRRLGSTGQGLAIDVSRSVHRGLRGPTLRLAELVRVFWPADGVTFKPMRRRADATGHPIEAMQISTNRSRPLHAVLLLTLLLLTAGPAAGVAVARARQRSVANASAARRLAARGHAGHARKFREAIVGGAPAPAGSFPWMAFVVYEGTSSFACSGTVLSPNVVLTAAHCLVDEATGTPYPPGGYSVITGTSDRSDPAAGQLSGVARTLVYPGFALSTLDGDAGLLVLSTPTSAPAVSLATAADAGLYQAGTSAAIAGWGETQYGSGQLPAALQWAPTVIQSPDYCQASAGLFDAQKVCTTDAPSFTDSTCFGDSGGPLVANDVGGRPVEIGITSTGAANCSTSAPDVFTRTDLISTWTGGWVAALAPASSSPLPTGPAPPPSSPTLKRRLVSLRDAASFTRQTLRGVFGGMFTRRRGYVVRCSRLARARVRCLVAWSSGRTSYRGSVTVFYARAGGHARWASTYRVRVGGTGSYGLGPKSRQGHILEGSW